MPIYKPSELRLFLSNLGIFPKKGLSQNFLIDGNIIRKIVTASSVSPGDVVLEIGPGPGSLTQILLETGAHVIAVEMDTVLARELERLKTPTNQLDIFCDDIMNFPFKEKLAKFVQEGKKIKVIANLPYHLTTPIVAMIIPERDYFSSCTFMVQEEVGRRFAASPGNKDYSSFTVFLNYYTVPHYAFTVSNHCFYPEPKVNSAVVVLDLKEPPYIKDETIFFKITRTAFEHRRKMMRASLKNLFPSEAISASLTAIGLNPLARPEDLSLQDFIRFYEEVSKVAL